MELSNGKITLAVAELEMNYKRVLEENGSLSNQITSMKEELEVAEKNFKLSLKMTELHVNENIALKDKLQKLEEENKTLTSQIQQLEKYKNASLEVKEIMKKISLKVGEEKND